jgi:glycosyltransferase involved in cell wall biosynthesis
MNANKHPKISIVTPSFNQGQYLEAAIDSVLSQGYPNLEYIIIDGGSTDNSVEIIKKYAHHLHFWCSEADDGHYSAVNKGFKKASGDIFAWLNSDDMYCPDAFRTVGAIFSQFPEVSWLTTLKRLLWDSQGHCKFVKSIPGYSRQAFLDGRYFTRKFSGLGFIQQESTFWCRELWEKVGGVRTEFNLAGDFDLWARYFLHADLYGVDLPLAGFRVHDKNRSHQINNYIFEAEQALDELRLELNWTRETRPPVLEDVVKKVPIISRLAELCNMSHKKRYVGTNISRSATNKGETWQMISLSF